MGIAVISFARPAPPGPFPDTDWIDLALSNGWVALDPQVQTPPSFRRHHGIVHVRGLIASGSATPESPIATLPAGFRPNRQHHLPATASNAFASLGVAANGVIVSKAGSNTWFSLDAIAFQAYQ